MLRDRLTTYLNIRMKRAIFTGIQNKHTVACDGYRAPAVRTGYEYVVPHRTGDLFCTTAKQAGTVESITEKGIIVKYKDGTTQGIELGRRFGISSGSVIPHYLETPMRVGQKFEEGDVVAYNSKFFELDYFNPKAAVLKFNTTAKIGLFEHALTEEDSSLISPKLSQRMSTDITHLRTVVVSFKDTLAKVVELGDQLTPNDILCYIHPEVASTATGIDDPEALAALTEWSRQTPKAKYPGVVERIECYYHGILADMSPTVRKLAEVSDKELKARNKAAGKPIYGGMVDDSYRLEGEAIPLDSMAINFYITVPESASVGDKLVFGNQLKTVIGEVFDGSYTTESGVELEGIFGQASIDDRIIDSLPRMGGLNTLLKLITTKTISAYRNL